MYINKEKFDKLIINKGLKISFIIDKSDVSRATFYKYLNNIIEVDNDFINKIENIIGCPKNYLVR